MGDNKYCQISRKTPAASIQNTWNEDFYTLQELLDLIAEPLQIVDKIDPNLDEL